MTSRPARRRLRYGRAQGPPKLAVMVKAPVAGRVKSRLARILGAVRAAAFYRICARQVVMRLAGDPRWELTAFVTPDRASGAVIRFGLGLGAVPVHAQGQGDLGGRMQRIFDRAAPGPVIIIGTDIPAIKPAHVAAAFAKLRGQDAVLGPTADGGYWLVGLSRCPRVLRPFAHVRWSTPHALADTLGGLKGARVARCDELRDVDDEQDYLANARVRGRLILGSLSP